MAFDVFLTDEALSDIAKLHEYLASHDAPVADRIIGDLDRVLRHDIGERPGAYAWFYLTGAPLRARLFRVSRRTQYWVIYDVDEDARRVSIMRIWNASRDPARFEI